MTARNRAGLAITLSLLFGGSPARAELLVGAGGAPVPRVVEHRAVVIFDGQQQTLQETLVLEDVRGRFARFVAVDGSPRFPEPMPDLEADLRDLTRRRTPHRFIVRDDPFGPSLLGQLQRSAEPPGGPRQEPARAAAVNVSRASFQGQVVTSTITRQPGLPLALEGFISRHRLDLDRATSFALAKALNEGRTVVGTLYEPAQPAEQVVLGPVRIALPASAPRLWLWRLENEPTLDLFVVADGPFGTSRAPFDWTHTPWAPPSPEPGRAIGLVHETWPVDLRGIPPWVALGATEDRTLGHVTHARYRPAREPDRTLGFAPAPDPPSPPRRGSATDLALVLLFGAVPVFAAPESWLLAIWQARARSKAMPTRVPITTRIWFAWPVVVAGYWLATLEGAGRWAAVLPIGIALLGLRPYEPPHRRFVRARLEKKRPTKGRS